MAAKVNRVSVDLTAYPDLVVIYLGMRVNSLRGLATLFGFGPFRPCLIIDLARGTVLKASPPERQWKTVRTTPISHTY
jgi:hypothetical protein